MPRTRATTCCRTGRCGPCRPSYGNISANAHGAFRHGGRPPMPLPIKSSETSPAISLQGDRPPSPCIVVIPLPFSMQRNQECRAAGRPGFAVGCEMVSSLFSRKVITRLRGSQMPLQGQSRLEGGDSPGRRGGLSPRRIPHIHTSRTGRTPRRHNPPLPLPVLTGHGERSASSRGTPHRHGGGHPRGMPGPCDTARQQRVGPAPPVKP
jgi:hypothetical protein